MTLNTTLLLKDKTGRIHNQTWFWRWAVTAAWWCLLWSFSFLSSPQNFPTSKSCVPVLLGLKAFYYIIPADVAERCTD